MSTALNEQAAVTDLGQPCDGSRIAGLGAHRPAAVVTNEDAAALAGVTAEWIVQRVGVQERRHADDTESVVSMAVAAGKEALADAGADARDVDVVVLATCSLPSSMPNGAAQIAARLGCEAAAGFDVNAACSGFSHAIAVADALVRAGSARAVLVVGSERMSDWVASDDRSTGPIFADGAAAALVLPSDRRSIFPVAWGSDGSRADLIRISAQSGHMEMAGSKVFRWTTSALAPVIHAACERAGVDPADLKAFVPHQANLRIIDALRQSLDAPDVVTATDITSAGRHRPLQLWLRQRGLNSSAPTPSPATAPTCAPRATKRSSSIASPHPRRLAGAAHRTRDRTRQYL
ncbi:beta-ketoacyl-ACP synthase 3 [Streptomyces sp. NPDC092903]|uniref:beta-ketoacyl-ACP synthase 3 n=1 Tax=Streptomyces sp. NPDC092903 TaxID=3366017 RepID=UPI0037F9D0B3